LFDWCGSAGLEAYRGRSNYNTVVEAHNDSLPVSDVDRFLRPSVYDLSTHGYSLCKALSKLDSAPGRLPPLVEGAPASKLQSSDPLPLVCASLERWSLVTGTRVGAWPPPLAPRAPEVPQGLESHDEAGGGRDASDAPQPTFEVPQDRNVEVAYKHMFTTLEDRAAALEGRLSEMADAIMTAYGLSELVAPVGTVSQVGHLCRCMSPVPSCVSHINLTLLFLCDLQTPIVYIGRVVVDGEGKINPASVLLEGNTQGPLAAAVPTARVLLDLRDVPAFSLFPGQVRMWEDLECASA
jgi:hypothetical protein